MRARCAEAYAELRDHCPVSHSEAWGGFWVASRYEDVYEVGRDVERFASGPGVMLPPVGHGRPLLPMDSDPPEHPEYKRLLLPRFAPAAVAGMEQDVRDLARGLVEGIAGRGEADLYETLCKPLPMLLITSLLGIERDEAFWAWTDTLIYGRVDGTDADEIRAAADWLYGFLAAQIADRRANPGGEDLISLLLRGDVEGRPYREDEILDLCFFLLIAGLENTAFGIRATLRHLAVEPAHRAAVLADPALVHNLVEQSLRLYAPVTALCRTATRTTEVAGPDDRRGRARAAPVRFGKPRSGRVPGPRQLPSRSPGRPARGLRDRAAPLRRSNLARLELRVAVEELLRLIPDFRLADGPIRAGTTRPA